jgi:tetratricopeptide (TPR) repeat protein
MGSNLRSIVLPAILAVSSAGALALDLRFADFGLSRPYDVLHVPSGSVARVVALGQRTFLSDMYWLTTVQYIGEPKADQRGWDKLYPLVDLVTDLDPRHGYAYQTAGIVLSSAGRLDESDAILEKGIAKGPPRWTFPFYLAFNHWFYRGDYATAARYAEQAARAPGASPNISHLAVALASKSGSPDGAIAMLQELRKTVSEDAVRERLDDQLKLAVVERDAQALEKLVATFERETRRPIRALEDLVTAGLIDSLPPDPNGGHYLWDPKDRRVHSSVKAFRFSPPEAPAMPQFHYKPRPENDERVDE